MVNVAIYMYIYLYIPYIRILCVMPLIPFTNPPVKLTWLPGINMYQLGPQTVKLSIYGVDQNLVVDLDLGTVSC